MKWVMIAVYMAAQTGEIVETQRMATYRTLDECRAHMHQKEFTYAPMPEGANAVIFYCDEVLK